MGTDRYTNLSSETLVLIDATKSDIEWDEITCAVRAWMLAVGNLVPKYTEKVEASEEDVQLLLSRARMLIADTDRFQDLAVSAETIFIPAWGRSVGEVVDSIDRHWHG